MAKTTKFKMAAAAPVAIFNVLPTVWLQPPYKFSYKYHYPRLNYNNFCKFKMVAVRHLGFSKTWFLTNGSPLQLIFDPLSPKNEIQNDGHAILNLLPVAIFDIQPTFHCWSQPPQKMSCKCLNRRLTYGNFSKFKMAAVRHLGIVVNSYKTTQEASLVGHTSLSNFMSIRCTVLKIWGFEFILQIWLEMPIHDPKISVLGDKIWENLPLGEKWPLGN